VVEAVGIENIGFRADSRNSALIVIPVG